MYLQIFENLPVTGIQTRVDDFGTKRIAAVETGSGTIKTDAIVNCTGMHKCISYIKTILCEVK